MGFLDSLNERIDAAADWTGEKLEEGTEWVGDRTEDGLRWGGDQLTEAGWDGGGEAMHEAADGVANVTGAELDERELGQTEDPKELIRGEPSAIESKSTTLSEMSTSIGNTGEALAAIKVNDWAGDGADAFNAVYSTQPGLWAEASSAFSTASSAYKTYSGQLKAAQKKAGDAIDEWKKGERYRDRYNALSSEEKSKSTLDTKAKDAFEAAKEILRGARADRDNAVGVASGELDSAAATAPKEPPFLTKMGQNVSDFMSMGDQAMTSFTEGLVTGTTGMVAFVRSVNPTDSYNRTHPAEYMSRMSDMGTGLVQAAADPGAVVDAMWTEFKEDPFKAFGAAVPEALVGLGTGGAGTAAARSANITRKLADIGTPPRGTPDAPTTPRPNPTSTSTPGDAPTSRPGGTDPATRPTSSDPSPSPAPDRAGGPEQSSTPEPGPAASPDSGPIEAPVNAGPSDSPAPQATPESSSAPAQSATPEPSEAPHQSTTPEHSGTPAESSPASPQSSPDTGGSTDSTPEPRTAPDSPGHADSPAETSHGDSPAAAESTRSESVPPAATPDSDGIDSTDLNLGDNTPGTSAGTPEQSAVSPHDAGTDSRPDTGHSTHASESDPGDRPAAESTRGDSVPPAATPDGQQPGQSPAAAPDSADPAHSPASDGPTAGRDQGPGTTGPGEPGSPRTGGPTSATPEQPGDTPKQHDAPASDSTTPAGDNHNGIRPAAVPPVAALAPSPGTAIPSSSAPHGNGPATPGPAATPSTPHNSNPHGSSNQPGSTKDPANRPHATEPDVPEASHAPDTPGPTPTPDPDKSPGPDAKPHHGPEAHPDTNSDPGSAGPTTPDSYNRLDNDRGPTRVQIDNRHPDLPPRLADDLDEAIRKADNYLNRAWLNHPDRLPDSQRGLLNTISDKIRDGLGLPNRITDPHTLRPGLQNQLNDVVDRINAHERANDRPGDFAHHLDEGRAQPEPNPPLHPDGPPTPDELPDRPSLYKKIASLGSNLSGRLGEWLTNTHLEMRGYDVIASDRPFLNSRGETFRPDFLAVHRDTGEVIAIDSKFGPNATLTNNQATGYTDLARGAGLDAVNETDALKLEKHRISAVSRIEIYSWRQLSPGKDLIDATFAKLLSLPLGRIDSMDNVLKSTSDKLSRWQ